MKLLQTFFLLCFIAFFGILHTDAQSLVTLEFKTRLARAQVDSVLSSSGIPSFLLGTKYDVDCYRVVYNTVNPDSSATTASGLLVLPVGPPCHIPMVSYQHGTMARKRDAPSRLKGEYVIGLISASTGYCALMPDYLGLGDGPGLHPYIHAQSEASATIDFMRAARLACDSLHVVLDDQVFLMGYSQGGHATMATQKKIQESYSDEFHITASAPMSGPYDVSGVMADIITSDSTYPAPSYLPYILLSWNPIYHLFDSVQHVMITPYSTTLPPLFNGNYTTGYIEARMPAVPNQIMQPALLDSFKRDSTHYFRTYLKKNDLYDWAPEVPTRMIFCQGDRSVPYQNAQVAYSHFVANGSTSVDTLDVVPALDHFDCAKFALLSAKSWFDSLRYTKPFASTDIVPASGSSIGDGTITLTGRGSRGPYTYSWSTGDTGRILIGAMPGTYTVTITDAFGCDSTFQVTLGVRSGLNSLNTAQDFSVYPNPAHDVIYLTYHPAVQNNDLNIVLRNANGEQVKTWTMRGDMRGNPLPLGELPGGIYFLQLHDGESLYVQKFCVW